MTLGGLALAVGILVDDATVTIENIERFLEEGKDLHTAILEGAGQISIPALVSTLCICIVFIPMFLLSGVAKYLFVPLAEAVVFAMLASYILSRTLVPTLAMYLLRAKEHASGRSRNPFVLFQRAFERGFERVRTGYQVLLTTFIYRRFVFVPLFLLACVCHIRSDSLAGTRLLPRHRYWPVQTSRSSQNRHPHRRNRSSLRSGRDVHTRPNPKAGSGQRAG